MGTVLSALYKDFPGGFAGGVSEYPILRELGETATTGQGEDGDEFEPQPAQATEFLPTDMVANPVRVGCRDTLYAHFGGREWKEA